MNVQYIYSADGRIWNWSHPIAYGFIETPTLRQSSMIFVFYINFIIDLLFVEKKR